MKADLLFAMVIAGEEWNSFCWGLMYADHWILWTFFLVVSLMTLQSVTAQPCGQLDQYKRRGGEDLSSTDWGYGKNWLSNKLGKYLFYSEWKGLSNTLELTWSPKPSYPVVTVVFENGAVANYYSKDGLVCYTIIHNPAANVKSVTARP